MDVALRYWNEENEKLEMRYWSSYFLGHAAHTVALFELH